MTDASSHSRLQQAFALFFVGVIMPVLLVIAWRMALEFDPFSMSFFTKQRPEITAETPGEMRIAGGFIAALGALLFLGAAQSIRKRLNDWKSAAFLGLAGLEIIGFSGAFFVAADATETAMEQEQQA